MDFYLIVKFLHVVAAVVWLGGGFALFLMATVQARQDDPTRLLTIVGQLAYIGPRLFMPASIATLLTGLAAAYLAGFGWPAWVVLGFIGILATSLLGALKLGPMSGHIVEMAKQRGPDAVVPDAMALIRLARFDYILLFSIVFLMIAKPDWQDLTVLAIPALAILLGAFMTIRPIASTVSNA